MKATIMLEQVMQKTWKIINNGDEKGASKNNRSIKQRGQTKVPKTHPQEENLGYPYSQLTFLQFNGLASESEPSDKQNLRRTLTRPGRLRARCGYIGPEGYPDFAGKIFALARAPVPPGRVRLALELIKLIC